MLQDFHREPAWPRCLASRSPSNCSKEMDKVWLEYCIPCGLTCVGLVQCWKKVSREWRVLIKVTGQEAVELLLPDLPQCGLSEEWVSSGSVRSTLEV